MSSHITLSRPLGVLYAGSLVAAVALAIGLPFVSTRRTNMVRDVVYRPIITIVPIEDHDPFKPEFDPFYVWNTSTSVQNAFSKLSTESLFGQVSTHVTDKAHDYEDLVKKGAVGTLFNTWKYQDIRKFQEAGLKASCPPLIIGCDAVHGFATIFPIDLAQSCAWDPLLNERTAHIAAMEMVAEGVHVALSPMMDITRDPRWGRVGEARGEDPYLSGVLGAATVRGLQTGGVASCVKHVAAHGSPEAGQDYVQARVSPSQLYNEYLLPYRMALMSETLDAPLENQAWMAMTGTHLLSGIPASAHHGLLTNTLRARWGWHGVLVGLYKSVSRQVDQRYASNVTHATLAAITSGLDQDMADGLFWDIKDKVDVSTIIALNHTLLDYVAMSAKRVLAIKERLNLFDLPYPDQTPDRAVVRYTPEAMALAVEAAERSAVLLKNEDDTLPIQHSADNRYLLVGSIATSIRDVLGAWTGIHSQDGYKTEDLLKHTTTYKAGLEQYVGKESLVYEPGYIYGLDATGARAERYNKANAASVKSLKTTLETNPPFTHIIVVLGEHFVSQGESTSRTSLTIAGGQMDVVKALVDYRERLREADVAESPTQAIPKLIFVYNSGRPLTMVYESMVADAILYMWTPGMGGGTALVNLLFGSTAPSGHLSITFPRSVGQIPIYYSKRQPPEHSRFGRQSGGYIDEYAEPLWPFGYGLTYGTFTITETQLLSSGTISTVLPDQSVEIRVQVSLREPSSLQLRELVQIYLRAPISQPVVKLVGFAWATFEPGVTSASVDISVNVLRRFGYYNAYLQYVVAPGTYELYVRRSAAETADEQSLSVQLTGEEFVLD